MKKNVSVSSTVIPAVITSCIVVLSIVQLLISNKFSTDGAKLSHLESEIASYKDQNSHLEEEIMQSMSLAHIASQAAEHGFVKQNNITAISAATRIALHQ